MLTNLRTNGRPIDSSDGAVMLFMATGRVATTFAYERYGSAFSDYLRGKQNPDLAFGAGLRSSGHEGPVFSNTIRRETDPEGGYWIPPDLSGRMRERSAEISPFRQYADVAPCVSDRL